VSVKCWRNLVKRGERVGSGVCWEWVQCERFAILGRGRSPGFCAFTGDTSKQGESKIEAVLAATFNFAWGYDTSRS